MNRDDLSAKLYQKNLEKRWEAQRYSELVTKILRSNTYIADIIDGDCFAESENRMRLNSFKAQGLHLNDSVFKKLKESYGEILDSDYMFTKYIRNATKRILDRTMTEKEYSRIIEVEFKHLGDLELDEQLSRIDESYYNRKSIETVPCTKLDYASMGLMK